MITKGGAILTLTVRADSTYDYLFAPGVTKNQVVTMLRSVADQIDAGDDIDNPTWGKGPDVCG